MKKRHILFGSLAFLYYGSKAQSAKDSVAKKVVETEIELLYSHYMQDGNNSAITGGVGTESLTVYGPSLTVNRKFGKNALKFQLGGDVVSSASTDKIDFIVSSPSILDTRYYANGMYEREFSDKQVTLNTGVAFSIESDYYSFGKFLGVSKRSKNEMQDFNLQLQAFNDDLRWRNIFFKPTVLIYPSELRSTDWFEKFRRNSYNVHFAYTRILNQRNTVGLATSLSFQHGLLSTPFHRVYFNDGSLKVENLPGFRHKESVALKWNTFAGGMVVLRNTLNGYIDNFGILAFSIENETAIKVSAQWTLTPNFRYYMQSKSDYFAGFKEHDPTDKYYTSDYDLSALKTYTAGMGIKYTPKTAKHVPVSELNFNYNYFQRSNGLKAHMMSMFMQFKVPKKEKKKEG